MASGAHGLLLCGRVSANFAAMKELISQLIAKADLDEAQAAKVAEVVRGFVSSKLPEALRGPVDSALTGQSVDSALDQAKGLVGKLF